MSGVQVPAPLLFFIGLTQRITLIKRFASFCKTNRLFSSNDLIFVALSGGMDSMALLHFFLALRDEFKLRIQAVHINHGVRGTEAERDEQFVRHYCQKIGVPLIVRRLPAGQKSDEQSLRDARYEQFAQVLSEQPQAKLATGHTLNDNVETFLMRVVRGASLKGLSGIPVKRGPYIRPLLSFTRAEIESFVHEQNIPFVTDSTNRDEKILRNRIRWQLLPLLENLFGASVLNNVARSMARLAEHYHLFEQESRKLWQQVVKKEKDTQVISLKEFERLPFLYRQQVLTYCVSAYYPLNYTLSEQMSATIERFIQKAQPGARLSLKGKVLLVKERGQFRILREPEETKTVLSLDKNATVKIDDWEITIQEVPRSKIVFSRRKDEEFICGDALKFPLVVRYWQNGDRFFPLGLGKSQKLKTFFVNQKIERWQKHKIPLVLNGNEIVWVCGLRLDQRYQVTENCKSVFKLELKKWRDD